MQTTEGFLRSDFFSLFAAKADEADIGKYKRDITHTYNTSRFIAVVPYCQFTACGFTQIADKPMPLSLTYHGRFVLSY
jgi:hypothetical protein